MKSTENMLDLASEYTPYPAGRFRADGPYSGEAFRDDVLLKRVRDAVHARQVLTVRIDGVRAFGSSFLEEAFGGLVRKGVSREQLLRHVAVVSSKPSHQRYIDAINRYMRDAKPG